MRKPRLGVDIDNVIVRSDLHWDWWLMNQAKLKESQIPKTGKINYNISTYYPMLKSPFDFWRSETLYDNMKPTANSQECLEALSNHFDIIFVTAIKGNHHKSKYYFVEKYFPFLKGFIATKEKDLVDLDIMIDDRVENLDKFPPETYKILFGTRYKQNREHSYRPANNWLEAQDRAMTYLETKKCLSLGKIATLYD